MKTSPPRGFTLLELMLVVGLIALLTTLACGAYNRLAQRARVTCAQADLVTIREAFLNPEGGYLKDMASIPGFSYALVRLANLFIATNLYGSALVAHSPYPIQTRAVRLDEGDEATCARDARARPAAFTTWDDARARGWRGPYLKNATALFPSSHDTRFPGDAPFGPRGFFPSLAHLRLPRAFKDSQKASIYGFVHEPTLLDPWENPYVIQVPPPQAFLSVTNVSDRTRFQYARVVSAGPNGILETPCFGSNPTNFWGATLWSESRRRLARQAGRLSPTNTEARGDDLVLFFQRADLDEGEAPLK